MSPQAPAQGHRVCSVGDCYRRAKAHGMCDTHLWRLKRGKPMDAPIRPNSHSSLEERLWGRVTKTSTCWLWTGNVTRQGYGRVQPGDGRPTMGVHRLAYELLVGPIPEGLVLDHLCRVPRCVNPSHLEPVTNAENLRRGVSPSALNGRKTHCIHGHEFSGDNLRFDPTGRRVCRACERAKWRRRRAS